MTPKKLLVLSLLFITSILGAGAVIAMNRIYEDMCIAQGKQYVCVNGRGQNPVYSCIWHQEFPSWRSYHACYPETYSGESCWKFYNDSNYYVDRRCYTEYGIRNCNFVGCQGEYNCFCNNGVSGSVVCTPDQYGDSCGNAVITTTPSPTVIITNSPSLTPTASSTPTATPTPPLCNYSFSMSYNEACNIASFRVSELPETHRNSSNEITGPVNCNNWNGNSKDCEVTGSASITWTHKWQDCKEINGNTYCSATCSKPETFNTNQIVISCSEVSSVTPHSLTWGEENGVNINYSDRSNSMVRASSENLTINVNPGATRPLFTKLFSSGNISSYNFNVIGPTYPSQINGNLSWTQESISCPNIVKNNCTGSFNLLGDPPASYLKTSGGDVYIGGNLHQYRFPTIGSQETFSTYSYGSASPFTNEKSILFDKNSIVYSCFSAALNNAPRSPFCSSKDYLITVPYEDTNSPSLYRGASSWFDYVYLKTEFLPEFSIADSTTFTSNYQDNKIIFIDGNFTVPLNSQCRTKNIFLINGDLILNPDFLLANSEAACLFVVKGSTTIPNYPSVRPAQTPDTIQAFVITGGFASESRLTGDNVLKIRGGLITEQANSLKRNINNQNGLVLNNASEIIEYEGARYIKAFKNVLSAPTELSIREVGYNL